jgi:hypothetical protein
MAPVEGGRFDEAALSLGAEAVAIVADGQHVAVVQRAASHPTTRPASKDASLPIVMVHRDGCHSAECHIPVSTRL